MVLAWSRRSGADGVDNGLTVVPVWPAARVGPRAPSAVPDSPGVWAETSRLGYLST